MYRLFIICMATLLVVLSGCNKEGKSEEKGSAATLGANSSAASNNPEDGESPGDEAGDVVTLESWQSEQEKDLPLLPEGHMQIIRDTLIAIAPEYGFTYDEERSMVVSGDPRPLEVELDPMVEIISLKAREENRNLNPDDFEKLFNSLYEKLCRSMYMEFLPPEEEQQQAQKPERQNPRKTGRVRSGGDSGSEEKPRPQKPKANKILEGLEYASSPIGLWKSVREENPRLVTYHNDDYFDYLELWHDYTAFYKVFRKKQMATYKEFTYSYNARDGMVSLTDTTGNPAESLTVYMEPGNEDLLYVQRGSDDSVTVYERIGTGYPPPPDPSGIGPGAGSG